MSVVGYHAVVSQRVNANHTDLAMAEQSPKGTDWGRGDEESKEETGKISDVHRQHLSPM